MEDGNQELDMGRNDHSLLSASSAALSSSLSHGHGGNPEDSTHSSFSGLSTFINGKPVGHHVFQFTSGSRKSSLESKDMENIGSTKSTNMDDIMGSSELVSADNIQSTEVISGDHNGSTHKITAVIDEPAQSSVDRDDETGSATQSMINDNSEAEKFILEWTESTTETVGRDAVGSELDPSGELKNLIQCIYANDRPGTEKELANLLKRIVFETSIVTRAKLYSRLIAIALQLRPADVLPDGKNDATWKQIEKKLGRGRRLTRNNKAVLPYLWSKLEEDDDIMTLFYAHPSYYRMYPVPYFKGCTLEIVEAVSKLWLSVFVLHHYYFKHIIDPIIGKLDNIITARSASNKRRRANSEPIPVDSATGSVASAIDSVEPAEPVEPIDIASMHKNRDYVLAKETLTNANFIKAKEMLWKELQKRGAKAGARLLRLMLMFTRHDNHLVGELVKEMFSRPRDIQFKKRFLFLERKYWSELVGKRGHSGYTDHIVDGEGQSINIGLPSSHTDYNLLCWAARRGYADLIWLVAQIYKPSPKSDSHYYVNHVLGEEPDAWKCALWCATRHGRIKAIRELLAPAWIRETVDFNDYPGGWMPPLHLVALLGDVVLLKELEQLIMSGANKKDYLGRTPLDNAMPFMSTSKKIKHFFTTPSKEEKRFNKKGQKEVVKKLLHNCGNLEERLKELYGMYIDQANTVLIGAALIASVAFVGWLQPPLGYTEYFQYRKPNPPAPDNSYDSYVAIEGHLSVEIFVVFNALSFFLAIATMIVGAEATLFVRDRLERTRSLIEMRKSIGWMIGLFIGSMLFIMVAFICAGMAIMPPIERLKRSMIVSLSAGSLICVIPLLRILWSLSENGLFFKRSPRLEPLKDDDRYNKSLIYSYSEKECEELFHKWDADEDGYITRTELLNIKSGDVKWAEVEVNEIMNKADDNGDFRLSLEEFKKMMMITEDPNLATATNNDPSCKIKCDSDENTGHDSQKVKRCYERGFQLLRKGFCGTCKQCLEPKIVRGGSLQGDYGDEFGIERFGKDNC